MKCMTYIDNPLTSKGLSGGQLLKWCAMVLGQWAVFAIGRVAAGISSLGC